MKAIRQLDLKDHPWLEEPALKKLLALLNQDGIHARMVGGCVRDSLLGRAIGDIDLACELPPEESLKRITANGGKVIPTGLKHGTITAVIEHKPFEITTLRHDVESFGRHAEVAFTDDWIGDAQRRDFTLNALYLDGDGSLYDPCGGLADLEARHIRFIGNPEQRIREDALRILRFFRFAAQIGEGVLDDAALTACIRLKEMIRGLSGERLAQEMFKILAADNILPVITVMAEQGILQEILPEFSDLERFMPFVEREQALGRGSILSRLVCLLPMKADYVRAMARHLRLSNKDRKTLLRFAEPHPEVSARMSKQQAHKFIYQQGRDVFIHALILSNEAQDIQSLLDYAQQWPVPSMPVQGRDLIHQFSGPALGEQLKFLEQKWIDSDFTLSRHQLIEG